MPVADWPVGMAVVVTRYNNHISPVLLTTIVKAGRTLVTTDSRHVFDVSGNRPIGKDTTNGYGTHLYSMHQYEQAQYLEAVRSALHTLTSPTGKTLDLPLAAALGEVLGLVTPPSVDSPLRQLLYLTRCFAYELHNEGIGRELLQQYSELVQSTIDKGMYVKTLNDPELRIPNADEL